MRVGAAIVSAILLTCFPVSAMTICVYVLGQSNASNYGLWDHIALPTSSQLRLWGNDNVLHTAPVEPIDCDGAAGACTAACGTPACGNQVDAVSDDPFNGFGYEQQLGMTLLAHRPTDTIVLVPCAKGNTSSIQWLPGAVPHLDRSTLYGSCNYRRTLVQSQCDRSAIVYGQGEYNTASAALWSRWGSDFATMVDGIKNDWGGATAIIYTQLSTTETGFDANGILQVQVQQAAENGYKGAFMVPQQGYPTDGFGGQHFSKSSFISIGTLIGNALDQLVPPDPTNTPTPIPTPTPRTTVGPFSCLYVPLTP